MYVPFNIAFTHAPSLPPPSLLAGHASFFLFFLPVIGLAVFVIDVAAAAVVAVATTFVRCSGHGLLAGSFAATARRLLHQNRPVLQRLL